MLWFLLHFLYRENGAKHEICTFCLGRESFPPNIIFKRGEEANIRGWVLRCVQWWKEIGTSLSRDKKNPALKTASDMWVQYCRRNSELQKICHNQNNNQPHSSGQLQRRKRAELPELPPWCSSAQWLMLSLWLLVFRRPSLKSCPYLGLEIGLKYCLLFTMFIISHVHSLNYDLSFINMR